MITGIISKFIPSFGGGKINGLFGFALGRSGLLISIGFTLLFYVLGEPEIMILFGSVSAFIVLWPLLKKLVKLSFILLAIYGVIRIAQTGSLPV
jgi:hypothetical protein